MRRWSIVLALVPLAACVSDATGLAADRFTGYYSQGFEVDAFRPCDSDERWWVTEGADLRTRYAALSPEPYEEVFVEVRGHAGPPGKYGHLGAYSRELAVDEVVTIVPSGQRGCS
jgi:hypothetical protein